jgi:monothiol glutaredoxin
VSINERIEAQLKEFPVLLYMKGNPDFPQCGFSSQVVNALKKCAQRFAYVNILEDPELRAGLKEYSDWPTFPQLYVNGELIGGSDIVVQMFESGELQKELSNLGQDQD